jgi:hypothetical protein
VQWQIKIIGGEKCAITVDPAALPVSMPNSVGKLRLCPGATIGEQVIVIDFPGAFLDIL